MHIVSYIYSTLWTSVNSLFNQELSHHCVVIPCEEQHLDHSIIVMYAIKTIPISALWDISRAEKRNVFKHQSK